MNQRDNLQGDGRFMAGRAWVFNLFVISALTKLLYNHHYGSLGLKAKQVLHWVFVIKPFVLLCCLLCVLCLGDFPYGSFLLRLLPEVCFINIHKVSLVGCAALCSHPECALELAGGSHLNPVAVSIKSLTADVLCSLSMTAFKWLFWDRIVLAWSSEENFKWGTSCLFSTLKLVWNAEGSCQVGDNWWGILEEQMSGV